MEAASPLNAPVEQVMSRAVVLMLEGIPMSEARAIAVQYDYNGFPIVTQDGRLVGMLTKGDLLRVARAALTDASQGDGGDTAPPQLPPGRYALGVADEARIPQCGITVPQTVPIRQASTALGALANAPKTVRPRR